MLFRLAYKTFCMFPYRCKSTFKAAVGETLEATFQKETAFNNHAKIFLQQKKKIFFGKFQILCIGITAA